MNSQGVVISHTFFCKTCGDNRTIWNRHGDLSYEQAKRRILAEQWQCTDAAFRCYWCVLMEEYEQRLAELSGREEYAWFFEPLPLGRNARRYKAAPQKMTVSPMSLGKSLRLARKERGLTQDEAAQRLGVARTTLVAMEQGQRHIKPGELVKLAQMYGRNVSNFSIKEVQSDE